MQLGNSGIGNKEGETKRREVRVTGFVLRPSSLISHLYLIFGRRAVELRRIVYDTWFAADDSAPARQHCNDSFSNKYSTVPQINTKITTLIIERNTFQAKSFQNQIYLSC